MRWLAVDERTELEQLEADMAAIRVEVALLRLQLAWKRYDPDQPRVPAGTREGGRWTDGEGVQALWDRFQPRTDWANNRPPRRGPPPVMVGGRLQDVTPAQAVRYNEAVRRADEALARVRRRDPGWRPPSGASERTVEGEILRQDFIRREAEARLRELDPTPPRPRPLRDVLGGGSRDLIGERARGAGDGIRTVPLSEFEKVLRDLTRGAERVQAPLDYAGVWYRRPSDGSIIGVRWSERYGFTIDVVQSGDPAVPRNTKVHVK